MQYFGGKQRIVKEIVPILKSLRKQNQIYLEPFVGAANVIIEMKNPRIGSDYHADIIMLLQAIQNNKITLPDTITEEEYYQAKHSPSSPLRGFIGFGCSYSGKWFGGYARAGNRNYCKNAKNSLLKKSKKFNGINFERKDYKELHPSGLLIYCDPPYQNHTKINVDFNHEEFWEIMRKWSKNNTVIISEYKSPSDFECIKEIPTKTDISGKVGKYKRIERLFKLKH